MKYLGSLVATAAMVCSAPLMAQETAPAAPASQQEPSPSAAIIAAQTPEQNAEALKLAREIVAIQMPPETMGKQLDNLMSNITKPMMASLPSLTDANKKAVADSLVKKMIDSIMPVMMEHMPKLLDATAQAFTREYSLAEIKDMRAFAETPSGKHMLSRATALMGDPAIAKANQEYMTALQSEMPKIIQDAMADLQSAPKKKK